MTSSVASHEPEPRPATRLSRSQLGIRASVLTPLWVFLALLVAQGRFWQPLFGNPPSILGLPLGLWLVGLAGLWMLLGVILVWGTRSRAIQAIALFLFTIPATIVLVMGPALILIVQNLG